MTRITVKVKVEIEDEIEIEVETDLMHVSIEEYMDNVLSNLQEHICLENYADWEVK
tara:strand:+ start:96 stop:263 length:168 start_codon:yes stop_codon:yes gene_type:complete